MSAWKDSLNSPKVQWSLEGERFDRLRHGIRDTLSQSDNPSVEQTLNNLSAQFPIGQVEALNVKQLKSYLTRIQSEGGTSVSMADIAKAYLKYDADERKSEFTLSILAGVTYDEIEQNTQEYSKAIGYITVTLSPPNDKKHASAMLDNIDKTIRLGEQALDSVARSYEKVNHSPTRRSRHMVGYMDVVDKLTKLVDTGVAVTKSSHNDGPKILIENILKLKDVKEDTVIKERAQNLLTSADALWKQSQKVDQLSERIWDEWHRLKTIQMGIVVIYKRLTKTQANPSNEARDWEIALGLEGANMETTEDKKDMGEVSDGYHTFNELYDHRTVLFNIILLQNNHRAWKSKLHHDGTMFDGYFIAGVSTPEGDYTYHQSMDWWDKFDVEEFERAPEWDGHKPEDYTRLYSLI